MNESSNSSSELMEEMNSDEERQLLNPQKVPKMLCETNAHTTNTDIIPKSLIGSNREDIFNDEEYLVYHRPKYTLPPYMDTKLASLSLREKVKITCSYHALIARSIANQAKIQIDSCSYPDPIDPIQKKNYSLGFKKDDSEIEESKETFGSGNRTEEYVSRAGRITKRKFYSEVEERKKDIVASPKGKEDEVSTKRKAPPTPTRNRNLRQKQSKLDSPEADTESIKKNNTKTASQLPISKQQKRSSDGFVEPAAPSSNKRAIRKTIECPICGKHFPEKEIEQHASSCGEIAMDIGSTNQSNVNGFQCHSCKKVMFSEEDYEIHCTTCNGGPSYLN